LAEVLGEINVDRLLASVTVKELQEWSAYFEWKKQEHEGDMLAARAKAKAGH